MEKKNEHEILALAEGKKVKDPLLSKIQTFFQDSAGFCLLPFHLFCISLLLQFTFLSMTETTLLLLLISLLSVNSLYSKVNCCSAKPVSAGCLAFKGILKE